MVLVKFRRQWRNYNDGEVTGWDEEFAKRLVDAGIADYVNGEETPTDNQDDEHKRHNNELTVSKLTRMNVDQLKELAAEHNVAIEEGELKPAILAKVKAVLFPDEA